MTWHGFWHCYFWLFPYELSNKLWVLWRGYVGWVLCWLADSPYFVNVEISILFLHVSNIFHCEGSSPIFHSPAYPCPCTHRRTSCKWAITSLFVIKKAQTDNLKMLECHCMTASVYFQSFLPHFHHALPWRSRLTETVFLEDGMTIFTRPFSSRAQIHSALEHNTKHACLGLLFLIVYISKK